MGNFGDKGYTGYRVGSHVREHVAHGVGVYHFFRDHAVKVKSAIVVPASLEGFFESPVAVYLNGKGVVEHVLNNKGDKTAHKNKGAVPAWVCGDSPPSPPPPSPPSPPSPTSPRRRRSPPPAQQCT